MKANQRVHVGGSLQISVYCLLHVGFLIGLLVDPEDGSDMFIRNVR
jgi:hypothetical protein